MGFIVITVPKRVGNYKPGPGRDSFEKKHGEAAVSFKLMITKSQHVYLSLAAGRDGVSIAEYIRKLITQDITRNKPVATITAEQTQYLKEHYGGIVAGITALIEKDKGETF